MPKYYVPLAMVIEAESKQDAWYEDEQLYVTSDGKRFTLTTKAP